MEHKNRGSEDDFPLQMGDFEFHVNLPGCMMYNQIPVQISKGKKIALIILKLSLSKTILIGKSWVPSGEYPRDIPTYTTYIWVT